jgi:hypothetical protein
MKDTNPSMLLDLFNKKYYMGPYKFSMDSQTAPARKYDMSITDAKRDDVFAITNARKSALELAVERVNFSTDGHITSPLECKCEKDCDCRFICDFSPNVCICVYRQEALGSSPNRVCLERPNITFQVPIRGQRPGATTPPRSLFPVMVTAEGSSLIDPQDDFILSSAKYASEEFDFAAQSPLQIPIIASLGPPPKIPLRTSSRLQSRARQSDSTSASIQPASIAAIRAVTPESDSSSNNSLLVRLPISRLEIRPEEANRPKSCDVTPESEFNDYSSMTVQPPKLGPDAYGRGKAKKVSKCWSVGSSFYSTATPTRSRRRSRTPPSPRNKPLPRLPKVAFQDSDIHASSPLASLGSYHGVIHALNNKKTPLVRSNLSQLATKSDLSYRVPFENNKQFSSSPQLVPPKRVRYVSAGGNLPISEREPVTSPFAAFYLPLRDVSGQHVPSQGKSTSPLASRAAKVSKPSKRLGGLLRSNTAGKAAKKSKSRLSGLFGLGRNPQIVDSEE